MSFAIAIALITGCQSGERAARRTHHMLVMRDGVELDTWIYYPADPDIHGIVLVRTPYNFHPELAYTTEAPKWITAIQYVRGRFGSGGDFVLMHPPHDPAGPADPKQTDDVTDAYDTVEWLSHLPEGNGKVCMWGVSYLGWTAAQALIAPHPALKCSVAGGTMGDMFVGDDLHHNGALRLSYAFEYSEMLEANKLKDTNHAFDLADTFDWYLRLGALSHAGAIANHDALPTWKAIMEHPDRDAYWHARTLIEQVKAPTVPILHVAGWYDQEDFYGPVTLYRALQDHDPKGISRLIVGPWNHGGWLEKPNGTKLGVIDYGSNTAEHYDEVEEAWFKHWLGDGPLDDHRVEVFETGSNRWRTFSTWPPAKQTRTKLYMRANHALSFDAPTAEEPDDTYLSDPANPVPYRHRPITPTYPKPDWRTWLVEDQRFVDHRPDVLSYQTAVLDHDVTINGDVGVELWAATSGTDSDWIVKVIDVYPDGIDLLAKDDEAPAPNPPVDMRGYQLMIADEIFRGRYRDGFDHSVPTPAGVPQKYTIDLHTASHTFLAGHRIMVQVQSTWFPVYDRNPQTFVPSIYQAKDSDFHTATQRVVHTPAMPSAIVLPGS